MGSSWIAQRGTNIDLSSLVEGTWIRIIPSGAGFSSEVTEQDIMEVRVTDGSGLPWWAKWCVCTSDPNVGRGGVNMKEIDPGVVLPPGMSTL